MSKEINVDILTIGGKEYTMHCGLAFVRELDKRYYTEGQGLKFGTGLTTIAINFIDRSPIAILDFIQAATVTEKQKPSLEDIDKLFEEWAEADALEEAYDAFFVKLATSAVTEGSVEKTLRTTGLNPPKALSDKIKAAKAKKKA